MDDDSGIIDLLFTFSIGMDNLPAYTGRHAEEVSNLIDIYLQKRSQYAEFPPVVDVLTLAFRLVQDAASSIDGAPFETLRSRLLPAGIIERPLLPDTQAVYDQLMTVVKHALSDMTEDQAAIENFPEQILALFITAYQLK